MTKKMKPIGKAGEGRERLKRQPLGITWFQWTRTALAMVYGRTSLKKLP